MKKISVLFLSGAMLAASSCGKFVDGYEISPNQPVEVTNPLLLNMTQVATFAVYNGQLARLSAVLVQQQAGTSDQFVPFGRYNLLSGDNTNEWEMIYTTCLMNAQTLIDQAGNENPYYRGMGRVLKAMNLGIATDFWGDVPNSEALKGKEGTDHYAPNFDSQESVIADIQQLLSDALVDFAKPESDNNELPANASTDYMFAGDVSKWTITAHILKARYANRLSKRDASGSATNALTHIDNAVAAGMTDWSSDANAVYGSAGNEMNPWSAFYQTRGSYMRFGKFFVDTLVAMGDPRLGSYAGLDAGGGYSGSETNGEDQNASAVDDNTIFGAATSSLPLVTYCEAKFIEAEAAFRASNKTRAAAAYNDAVISHITMITSSAPDASYITNYASETDLTISLDKIMMQKYIAMFSQPEVWSDWRRTGIPSLTPNPDNIIGGIPRRLLTPQSELNFNPNAPDFTNLNQLLTPMWWDE